MEPRRRFRIIKELSEGAFGKVYLSEMITGDNFKSVVAIKLLHGKWAGHEEIVQRSRDEARVLGLLHHRNIIRVEDLTSINGQCAVVMEYLNGVDMKTLCTYVREKEGRIPRKVVLEITAQIASALDAAYTHRPLQGGEPLELIHRDIKPSNVMLTCAGEVKVLDFGTAQARFDHREAQTQALAFGSAAYMAPERLLGDQDQPWGDVFSLGITLYEMLSLQAFGKVQVRPERNAEHLATCLGDLELSDLPTEHGKELKAFLSRMLSYEPEDRPTAMEVVAFMEDLSDVVNDGSVRRFCREVVTPCRETVEPDQDPNDPLAGSTLFEDTTTISEHATVVGGNWMDETEEEDSQASSLRSLGVDRGHIEASDTERDGARTTGEHDRSRMDASQQTMVDATLNRSEDIPQSGHTWTPDEAERSQLEKADEVPTSDFEASDSEDSVDSDQTGPIPLKEQVVPDSNDLADWDPSEAGTAVVPDIARPMDLPDEPESLVEHPENRSEEPSKVGDLGMEEVSGMGPSLTDGAPLVVDSENQTKESEASVDSGAAQAVPLEEDSILLPQVMSDEPNDSGLVSQDVKGEQTDSNRVNEDNDVVMVQTSRGKTVPILFAMLVALGVGGYFAWAQGLFGAASESAQEAEAAESMESERPTEESTQEKRSTRSQNKAKDREAESLGSLEGGQTYAYPDSDPGLGGTLRLRVEGSFAYVELSPLKRRIWDGQGQISLTGTPGDEDLKVYIFGSSGEETQERLATVADGVVCYELTVESEGGTLRTEATPLKGDSCE